MTQSSGPEELLSNTCGLGEKSPSSSSGSLYKTTVFREIAPDFPTCSAVNADSVEARGSESSGSARIEAETRYLHVRFSCGNKHSQTEQASVSIMLSTHECLDASVLTLRTRASD